MKIKKIYNFFILFVFLSFNSTFAQQADWVNVDGKSNAQIKRMILKDVKSAVTVDTDAIREQESKLQKEKDRKSVV